MFLIIIFKAPNEKKPTKRIVCYLQNVFTKPKSAVQGFSYFKVSDIDPNLCTHIIYSMARIDTETYDRILPYDPSNIGTLSILLGQFSTNNSNLRIFNC